MPYKSQWARGIKPPGLMTEFQHLAFLFNNTNKSTRGIIRMNIDEAACLWEAVKSRPARTNMVEIGRAEGGSTILMAVADEYNGTLWSIDLDPVNDERLKRVLRDFNVEIIVDDSQIMDTSGFRNVGLIFIDGDHTYDGVKADFENWFPRLQTDGFLVFHDVNDLTLENHGPSELYAELLHHPLLCEVASGGSVRVMAKR